MEIGAIVGRAPPPGGIHADAAVPEAPRRFLDRAPPPPRHGAGLVRGLDLPRRLRARARRDLLPYVAERRARRAAAAGRELLHEGDRRRAYVDRRPTVVGRRGPRVLQYLPPPGQQARVE